MASQRSEGVSDYQLSNGINGLTGNTNGGQGIEVDVINHDTGDMYCYLIPADPEDYSLYPSDEDNKIPPQYYFQEYVQVWGGGSNDMVVYVTDASKSVNDTYNVSLNSYPKRLVLEWDGHELKKYQG